MRRVLAAALLACCAVAGAQESSRDVRLHWTPEVQCVDGSRNPIYSYFSIHRSPTEHGEYSELPITPGADDRQVVLPLQLGPDLPRACYRMTSTGTCPDAEDPSIGTSGFSNTRCIEWDAPTAPPGPVRNLRMTWSAPGTQPTEWIVYTLNTQPQAREADQVIRSGVDAMLIQIRPDDSQANPGRLEVSAYLPANNRTTAIGVPALAELDRTVVRAELRLYRYSGLSPFEVHAHRLLRPFTADATWNATGAGSDWTWPGGLGDISSEPIAAADAPAIGQWIVLPVTADIQTEAARADHHGWLLKPDSFEGPIHRSVFFRSSVGTDGERPELWVEVR